MTYKPEKGSRQPVVLYDKDNKAIDVSGIKELSSIKIDTGKIAGDLKLVKDNQGRLYGKYGEAWIPVKVDSEGRPIISSEELATELTLAQILTTLGGTAADIGTLKLENGQIKGYDGTDWQPVRVNDAGELILASEVTVNAEGLSVDLGKLVLQAKNPSGVPTDMKSDTEGNLKVSLSGTIVNVASFTRPALAVNAIGQLAVDIDVEGYTRLVAGISSTSIPDKANMIVSWESDSPYGGVGAEEKEASFTPYGGVGGAVFEFPLSTSRVKRVVLENKSTVAWSDINVSIWKAR